jgi:putative DNA primase/helicase
MVVGRWPGVLESLGVPAVALTGRHCPCPVCGGTDRFRFDDKDGRGTWICNRCGAGDGFSLLQKKYGWSFAETFKEVRSVIGLVAPSRPRSKTDLTEEQRRKALGELWRASIPLQPGDLVDRYFRSRGIALKVFSKALRFCKWAPITGHTRKHMPAMLALVQDGAGKAVTLHRTYLAPDGSGKADMPSPRRLMPGPLPEVCSVHLGVPTKVLGVAEGIETALAAGALFRMPVWATINAARLESWEPPGSVEDVVVFADADANYHGQKAAYALANRLTRMGLRATVNVPPVIGEDWNDVLLQTPELATFSTAGLVIS